MVLRWPLQDGADLRRAGKPGRHFTRDGDTRHGAISERRDPGAWFRGSSVRMPSPEKPEGLAFW